MVEKQEDRMNNCDNFDGSLCDPWVRDTFGGLARDTFGGDGRTNERLRIDRESDMKKAEEICSKCENFRISQS
jgi:hypothetical protein